jgi:tetratricopeptide (TPR) repeat protein
MSRFVHLELGGDSEEQTPQQQALVKDGAYYRAEAKRAFENGDFERALRHYSKELEFRPNTAEPWTGQVRMLIELGQFQDAGHWADKALERFPRDAELLAAKAVALARTGDLQGALAFSDSAMEERGDAPYVWLSRGDVLLARKEPRADYCFEKALMLAPGDWLVAWLGARVRLYYKQLVLALKLLQRAVELNATHFLLWLELGRCQQALGLVGPARLSFEQARQLNAQCSEAGTELARLAHSGASSRLRGWWRRLLHL